MLTLRRKQENSASFIVSELHLSPRARKIIKNVIAKPEVFPSDHKLTEPTMGEFLSTQVIPSYGNPPPDVLSLRSRLPVCNYKHEIISAIRTNQVVLICGETGSGKTTQLPQFLIEQHLEHHEGVPINIVCTQPRRISAISVAERVSYERGEAIGKSVGYHVRLETKRSAQTFLLFCTTGVLLRRLTIDPDLTVRFRLLL